MDLCLLNACRRGKLEGASVVASRRMAANGLAIGAIQRLREGSWHLCEEELAHLTADGVLLRLYNGARFCISLLTNQLETETKKE